jgi:CRP/FNR family transcriptional regulator
VLNAQQLDSLGPAFPQILADQALATAIAGNAVAVRLGRGETICHEGDSCSHLALVTAGSARVYKLAESGREITLYRVEPGACCILTASCMLSGRAFPAHAAVEADLEAIVIPQARVVAWMQEHATWRHYLWNLLAARLADVITLVEEVSFRRIDQRLADYLAGHAPANGRLLQATHQQIAADLGTSREVVSRILKDFELRGMLDLGRGRIQVRDEDALRRISGDAPAPR